MQSRYVGLAASISLNGFFGYKLLTTTKKFDEFKKEAEQKYRALESEPTKVSVLLSSSAFKGNSLFDLGHYQEKSKDVTVTLYQDASNGNYNNFVGVSFAKK